MKVFTKNEYSALKHIIVDSAKQSAWPVDDSTFNKSIEDSNIEITIIKTRGYLFYDRK